MIAVTNPLSIRLIFPDVGQIFTGRAPLTARIQVLHGMSALTMARCMEVATKVVAIMCGRYEVGSSSAGTLSPLRSSMIFSLRRTPYKLEAGLFNWSNVIEI